MMLSFGCLCLLLGLGHALRHRWGLLRRLYLPSSVVAGLAGLVILQAFRSAGAPLPAAWTAGWSRIPGQLINIVFACLFLGVALPPLRTLWKRSGVQLAYGQIVAWGQYAVGVGLALILLGPLFGTPALFGGILPVGFEGGHGTAAGMGPVLAELGWPAGKDLALASATGGILGAILVGMILVNWAVRRGHVASARPEAHPEAVDTAGIYPLDQRPAAGRLAVSGDVIESFTLQLVAVGIAILIGIALQSGLLAIEARVPWLREHRLFQGFPLFPLCMLGGLAVQWAEETFDRHRLIDPGLIRRIQNTSLDLLVAAAIATIRLDVVLAGLVPLLILVAAGIAWNVLCVTWLARRVFPDAWFERAIAEMGQSMGVTATGLLLLRVVDPDYRTPAAEAFAGKQLLHEPFMGGGLWTGAALPLIAAIGAAPVFGISAGAMAFWALILLWWRPRRRAAAG